MKFLKIGISFLLVLLSLLALWLIRSEHVPLTSTGSFALTVASGITLTLGVFLLLLLVQKARKKELLTEEYVSKNIEEKLYNVKPDYLEGRLVFEAGSIASSMKKRGIEMERVTEKGIYLSYDAWVRGIRRTAKWLIEKYPWLREKSYLMSLLVDIDERVHPAYLDRIVEHFSHTFEEYKRLGYNFVPTKALKALAYTIEAYARRRR